MILKLPAKSTEWMVQYISLQRYWTWSSSKVDSIEVDSEVDISILLFLLVPKGTLMYL